MKIKFLFFIGLGIFTIPAFAQVGINTGNPTATLDVAGVPAITTTVDGIIPPRIAGAQLRAKTGYAAQQNGAIVYVTAADPAPSGQTVDVTAAGLYYFDSAANKWKALSGSNSSYDTTDDAWINNPANARVELGTTSAGASRAVGTEIVATDNGRVGIGTASPSTKLDISSATNPALRVADGTQGSGRVLTSDDSGYATWQTKGPQTTQGSVPSGNQSYPSNNGMRYIGYSITVPPGRSTITAGIILIPLGYGYATCRLSTSPSTFSQPSGVVPNYSGFTVVNSTSTGQVMWYANNTTGSSQTYYIWMVLGGGAAMTSQNLTVGGTDNYGETFIMVAY